MDFLEEKYKYYLEKNLIRNQNISNNCKSNIDFTSSDYLNIASSKNLKKSILSGFEKYGFGSKGSAAVCGYNDSTKHFEEKFANFVGYPKAIFFNSGYMANLAIYATLFNEKNTLFADKFIHASTIDGINLSKVKLKRYRHQNYNHLLKIYDQNSYIVTEGVFSTTGTITNLKKIFEISDNKIIVDEAHSLGVLGNNGRGLINHYNLNSNNCPIAIYPLGKAFGGVGAVVCTTLEIANYLQQFARSYIYTTAIPPLILEASIAQLDNLAEANQQRENLRNNILYFNKLSNERNLLLASTDISPIRSIIIKENDLALQIKQELENNSLKVSCFRYPTVPQNLTMLRLSIHANNTFSEIEKAINIITKF
ncbi:pyridoxal phosphate-dependent aminotransferase family protein [Francisella sp. Scap27]|uniref:aminotransferase class I/II-fold pyridoxal phosphate-dependent enzyme n=1 Tax=Francisella sp. Scap27 TaxID=2589986 RepID=UPI0015BF4B5C|nr:pyridoxal phosphate-dependent aminotransferase family protein [Francisella sp. Scap27]QLE79322.1 pyridoxal phosphate-dependent aminotransferase family protein [Francisella sp. Scap27]